MSSLRNAVQRRNHKERSQPLERRRLGLLEKHKDYSLRAKDYNEKKKHLKNLRDKAADRNEDEFYFGMMTRKGPGSRLKDGRGWSGTAQGDRGNRAMEVDTVRLLKTQDLGYVRTMRQVAAKELARLEEQLVLAGMRGGEEEEEEDELAGKAKTRKIVFVDDEAEREQRVHQHALGREKGEEEDGDEGEKKVRRLKMQVEHGRKKIRVLTDAENELEIQRAKMAKTATSGGHTRRGKKIMVRRRKR